MVEVVFIHGIHYCNEQLSIFDPSIGLSMAHNSLLTGHIMQFGNEDQKKKWLPKHNTGEWIGSRG